MKFYTLFISHDPKNHILFSGTYPSKPNKGVLLILVASPPPTLLVLLTSPFTFLIAVDVKRLTFVVVHRDGINAILIKSILQEVGAVLVP